MFIFTDEAHNSKEACELIEHPIVTRRMGTERENQ
jgi:hypothetical protein